MDKKEKKPRILAICGVKNSGKTTLIEKLVVKLTDRGKKIAVIKHDGHDFACDVPGTDSYRFWKAGAYGTAVYSDFRIFIHKESIGVREEELTAQFPEADLILIEGLKNSVWPKIEVIRNGISKEPISNPSGRFLIVTDWPATYFRETSLDFKDIDAVVDMIENKIL